MSNTIESIEQGNKLIGRFMGSKCEYDAPIGWIKKVEGLPLWEAPNERFHLEQGKYHTSWDWLMPVVEKIETLVLHKDLKDDVYAFVVNITGDCCEIDMNTQYGMAFPEVDFSVIEKSADSKKEAVYNAVIEFIEWYNNQKSNQ